MVSIHSQDSQLYSPVKSKSNSIMPTKISLPFYQIFTYIHVLIQQLFFRFSQKIITLVLFFFSTKFGRNAVPDTTQRTNSQTKYQYIKTEKQHTCSTNYSDNITQIFFCNSNLFAFFFL